MAGIWAEQVLTSQGWQQDVRLEVDSEGRISGLAANSPPTGFKVATLLPAPANCHSHSFQRAMAGLTEKRGPDPSDSFWTWRKLMYRFLEQITPEQVEAIAALVQMEMLEAGYGTNVEFHYLHHQVGGHPYDNLAELAGRVAEAASLTGIGLTLLPVQYQFGGCDQRPLNSGQLRFGNDPERFARLVDASKGCLESLPADTKLGVAPHSLRAVAREQLGEAATLVPDGPIHMHLAEQIPEVEEVVAAWGARPVEWALDNLELDERWCLIHLTQMRPEETQALAKTDVVAGLCPITEASLGDGIFDGVRWMNEGGRIAIGSDSNILISLSEEMRVLDTSQRVRDHSRASLAEPDISTGRRVFEGICRGGAQAAGRGSGTIAIGEWADFLALDMNHVNLCGLKGDTIVDSFAFAGGNEMVQHVWSAGRHMVKDGRHVHRDKIVSNYKNRVSELREGI